jgi:hypothetical protein
MGYEIIDNYYLQIHKHKKKHFQKLVYATTTTSIWKLQIETPQIQLFDSIPNCSVTQFYGFTSNIAVASSPQVKTTCTIFFDTFYQTAWVCNQIQHSFKIK